MENQNILISGASVACLALAWWLGRHGFRPTVVERAPHLRGGGYAVDFRGAAHLSVLAKMGVLDQGRERQTHLSATTYVDGDGLPVASMPPGIFAGDVEILRGDLGRILYEATRGGTEYLFGDSVTGLRQDAGGVHVTFAPVRAAHLRPGDRGRRAALRGARAGLRRPARSGRRPWPVRRHLRRARPVRPGSRGPAVQRAGQDRGRIQRTGNRAGGGAVLLRRPGRASLEFDYRDPGQQQKILASVFQDVGWQVPDLLGQLPAADDFYFDSVSQVRLDRWSSGRVALAGDAGYAAGPGGNGTGTAVVAAYVLAGS